MRFGVMLLHFTMGLATGLDGIGATPSKLETTISLGGCIEMWMGLGWDWNGIGQRWQAKCIGLCNTSPLSNGIGNRIGQEWADWVELCWCSWTALRGGRG